MNVQRRTVLASLAAAPALGALTRLPDAHAAPGKPRLTNLAHLDELTTKVRLTPTPEHTTYRLAAEPEVGMLWVYADVQPDGSYKPVGGGAYDAATDTWGQGAYDVDDIARAAIVYLREWRATRSRHARRQAYEMLRATAYFQTLTGANAGNFLLWMQPDGALNPTPTPPDNPNPADAGASYWQARCLWAFGEGYAAFRRVDAAFARFLRNRMELTLRAVQRQVLSKYGSYHDLHGVEVPAWLITDGADATSEAVLGLAPYVAATGSRRGLDALEKFSEGIAAMQRGTRRQWPYRAILPWAQSLDMWHAWGSQMAQALAAAAPVLGKRRLLRAAIGDAAGFTAQLLTATGPDNGWLPVPLEKVQIAYGADARVQACYATGEVTGRDGVRRLAGIAAGWFFGANRSGLAVYNPDTGVTFDGVEADGRVNRNSGAESTIHGLLTMQVLDDNPDLLELARASSAIDVRDGLTVLEAESATLTGSATVQAPTAAWTGEALWSGQQVVADDGAVLTWTLPESEEDRVVNAVVELDPSSSARSTFSARGRFIGSVDHGDVGAQGDAASPTRLAAVAVGHDVKSSADRLRARVSGGTARLDALLVMPVVARLTAHGDGAVTLLTSKSRHAEWRRVDLPGGGRLRVRSYDAQGRELGERMSRGRVLVAPGGFTIVTRGVR